MRAVLVLVVVALAGCASAPPSSNIAAASSSGGSAAESAATTGDTKRTFEPPPGWKVRIDGWDVVYCRKAPVLGSRVPEQICLTEAELKLEIARNESMRNELDKAQRICGTVCN